MIPEQFRRTIARAALPLLAEYETLTTAQIAEAAGIDEADLLAVYADKEAVMRARHVARTPASRREVAGTG
jgi:AcrR family transcriptional regulator